MEPFPPAAPSPTPPPLPEPLSPWFSIWTRPRATLRQILDGDHPRRGVLTLAALSGVASGLAVARGRWYQELSPAFVLPSAVVVGALGGIVGLYLMGFLLRVTGRWLRGQGDAAAVRAAIAWSQVPSIWGLLLWLPRFALLGGDSFHPDPPAVEADRASAMALLAIETTQVIVEVWQIVVGLKCVGEAHRFSAWRSLGALILALLSLVVPAVVVAAWLALPGGFATA